MNETLEDIITIVWAIGALILVFLPLSVSCVVFTLFLKKYKITPKDDTEQKSKYKFRAMISGAIAAFVLLVYIALAVIFMSSIAYM